MSVFLPDIAGHLAPSSEAVTGVSAIVSQSLATNLNLETLSMLREIRDNLRRQNTRFTKIETKFPVGKHSSRDKSKKWHPQENTALQLLL